MAILLQRRSTSGPTIRQVLDIPMFTLQKVSGKIITQTVLPTSTLTSTLVVVPTVPVQEDCHQHIRCTHVNNLNALTVIQKRGDMK